MTASNEAGYQVIRSVGRHPKSPYANYKRRVAAFIQADHANGLDGTFGSHGESYYQSWTDGQATINEGDNGLQLLDYAVQQAEANNIQFIIILAK